MTTSPFVYIVEPFSSEDLILCTFTLRSLGPYLTTMLTSVLLCAAGTGAHHVGSLPLAAGQG